MTAASEWISINLHLTRRCNMRCIGCFASYKGRSELNEAEWLRCIERIAEETRGYPKRKLNFVGGEPTLLAYLPRLVSLANESGFTTGVVSNGALIDRLFLDSMQGTLDWIGVSVDSLLEETNRRLGRCVAGYPMTIGRYLDLAQTIRERGFNLKINTVVSSLNQYEDFRHFIAQAKPARWKIMQFLRVRGQNWRMERLVTSHEAFERFFKLHSHEACAIKEPCESMLGSYVMIDPAGRPYGNVGCRVRYGKTILRESLLSQLPALGYDPAAAESRGGFRF